MSNITPQQTEPTPSQLAIQRLLQEVEINQPASESDGRDKLLDDIELVCKELITAQRELGESDKYRLALESLTPQGSEYFKDEQRCVEYVRKVRLDQHAKILEQHKQINQQKENAEFWKGQTELRERKLKETESQIAALQTELEQLRKEKSI